MEAVVEGVHYMAADDPHQRGGTVCIEVRVQRVHLEQSILMRGDPNRVDPDKWRPLIMGFQKFYGLQPHQAHESTLSSIPERMYRSGDVDKAREAIQKA